MQAIIASQTSAGSSVVLSSHALPCLPASRTVFFPAARKYCLDVRSRNVDVMHGKTCDMVLMRCKSDLPWHMLLIVTIYS